jgi:hypothetical protein
MFSQIHPVHKAFPLNISGKGAHPNAHFHRVTIFWIPIKVSARPSIEKSSKTVTSYNVGIISLQEGGMCESLVFISR